MILTSWPGDSWEVSSPEAEGVDPAAITQLDAEIRSGKHGYIDSMLIVRHGRIVFESYYEHDYATINKGREYPSPPPWATVIIAPASVRATHRLNQETEWEA